MRYRKILTKKKSKIIAINCIRLLLFLKRMKSEYLIKDKINFFFCKILTLMSVGDVWLCNYIYTWINIFVVIIWVNICDSCHDILDALFFTLLHKFTQKWMNREINLKSNLISFIYWKGRFSPDCGFLFHFIQLGFVVFFFLKDE